MSRRSTFGYILDQGSNELIPPDITERRLRTLVNQGRQKASAKAKELMVVSERTGRWTNGRPNDRDRFTASDAVGLKASSVLTALQTSSGGGSETTQAWYAAALAENIAESQVFWLNERSTQHLHDHAARDRRGYESLGELTLPPQDAYGFFFFETPLALPNNMATLDTTSAGETDAGIRPHLRRLQPFRSTAVAPEIDFIRSDALWSDARPQTRVLLRSLFGVSVHVVGIGVPLRSAGVPNNAVYLTSLEHPSKDPQKTTFAVVHGSIHRSRFESLIVHLAGHYARGMRSEAVADEFRAQPSPSPDRPSPSPRQPPRSAPATSDELLARLGIRIVEVGRRVDSGRIKTPGTHRPPVGHDRHDSTGVRYKRLDPDGPLVPVRVPVKGGPVNSGPPAPPVETVRVDRGAGLPRNTQPGSGMAL